MGSEGRRAQVHGDAALRIQEGQRRQRQQWRRRRWRRWRRGGAGQQRQQEEQATAIQVGLGQPVLGQQELAQCQILAPPRPLRVRMYRRVPMVKV